MRDIFLFNLDRSSRMMKSACAAAVASSLRALAKSQNCMFVGVFVSVSVGVCVSVSVCVCVSVMHT